MSALKSFERYRGRGNGLFLVALAVCVVLACWGLWTGGVFDDDLQSDLRVSSVHIGEGTDIDEQAAERIVGNRRLVVAWLPQGEDLEDACDELEGPAAGTVGLLLSPAGDEYDTYGCVQMAGADDEGFGRAYVAESQLPSGVDEFVDSPLDALKVVVVNYDSLVRAKTIPDGTRTIVAPLPRFLIAGGALAGVVLGASALYLVSRGAGRLTAARLERRAHAEDARTRLGAAAAVVAGRLLSLDAEYTRRKPQLSAKQRTKFDKDYGTLAARYAEVLPEVHDAHDNESIEDLITKVEELGELCGKLSNSLKAA
ncbi:hypothetical protein [Amycolatopsis sp. YIM 10]|uniref:hypothetical protein n=1 Tax=Amycolatopsis sp. YIM 10 TaxID=2653857 RepID=UPI00128FEA37|nr:hypothetical protein [Amycolatopsis sp. YIM 10]QFU89670.1 hypothetical protein YIM_22460 [Amycolatopsis sp. YIM 10]